MQPPDTFFVSRTYNVGRTGLISCVRVGGTLRTANVPTSDVPVSATNPRLSVFGYNTGTFTGDVATGSNLRVPTLGTDRPFTFAP